jgi:hypothetical protein
VNFSAVSLIRRQRQFYTFVLLFEALRPPPLKINLAFIQMLVYSLSPLENQPASCLLNIFFTTNFLSAPVCVCARSHEQTLLHCNIYYFSCIVPHIHAANISSPRLLRVSTNILELRSLHGTGSDLSAVAKSLPLLGEIVLLKLSSISSPYEF